MMRIVCPVMNPALCFAPRRITLHHRLRRTTVLLISGVYTSAAGGGCEASLSGMLDPMPGKKGCTICSAHLGTGHLKVTQAGERAAFCSFECMIEFALTRLRERREHHNQQVAELRAALKVCTTGSRSARRL